MVWTLKKAKKEMIDIIFMQKLVQMYVIVTHLLYSVYWNKHAWKPSKSVLSDPFRFCCNAANASNKFALICNADVHSTCHRCAFMSRGGYELPLAAAHVSNVTLTSVGGPSE